MSIERVKFEPQTERFALLGHALVQEDGWERFLALAGNLKDAEGLVRASLDQRQEMLHSINLIVEIAAEEVTFKENALGLARVETERTVEDSRGLRNGFTGGRVAVLLADNRLGFPWSLLGGFAKAEHPHVTIYNDLLAEARKRLKEAEEVAGVERDKALEVWQPAYNEAVAARTKTELSLLRFLDRFAAGSEDKMRLYLSEFPGRRDEVVNFYIESLLESLVGLEGFREFFQEYYQFDNLNERQRKQQYSRYPWLDSELTITPEQFGAIPRQVQTAWRNKLGRRVLFSLEEPESSF